MRFIRIPKKYISRVIYVPGPGFGIEEVEVDESAKELFPDWPDALSPLDGFEDCIRELRSQLTESWIECDPTRIGKRDGVGRRHQHVLQRLCNDFEAINRVEGLIKQFVDPR